MRLTTLGLPLVLLFASVTPMNISKLVHVTLMSSYLQKTCWILTAVARTIRLVQTRPLAVRENRNVVRLRIPTIAARSRMRM